MKILILGVNGFIGHHLTKRILDETDWSVYGMDLSDDRLGKSLQNPRFHFIEGDIAINREWIEYHVKKCDVRPAAGGDRHAEALCRRSDRRL